MLKINHKDFESFMEEAVKVWLNITTGKAQNGKFYGIIKLAQLSSYGLERFEEMEEIQIQNPQEIQKELEKWEQKARLETSQKLKTMNPEIAIVLAEVE